MAQQEKPQDRLQVPLMYAFRDAYEKRDSSKREDVRVDGERVITAQGSLRRRGVDERALKRDLGLDLAALLDTVNLDAIQDLSGLPYVGRSVLNYGIADLSTFSVGSNTLDGLASRLKAALLAHEPRLRNESLSVERSGDGDAAQRLQFRVHAEMACRPLDIPIDFTAEVDLGSGKVALARLPGA